MAQYIPIEVTQSDIDKADPRKSGRCVVARAIARTFPDARRIEVDVQSIRFTHAGERHVFSTPYPVTGYIVAFDAGDEIEPFRFRLNEAHRIGVKRTVSTPVGKQVDAARKKVQDRTAKVAKLEATPTASPARVKVAREELAEAQEQERTVKKAAAGKPQTRTDKTHGTRQAPQRSVWKTGNREYGNRRMAINGGSADKWTRPADEPK